MGDDMRAEGLALDEGHGVVRQPVGLADREYRNDVRLLERRGQSGSRARIDRRETPTASSGDRTFTTTLRREPRLLGGEHARHSAASELALEGVSRAECRLQLRA